MALCAAGISVLPLVERRLELAAQFFAEVQVPTEQWDYGDSDNAFVLPIGTDMEQTTREWLEWMQGVPGALVWLVGAPPKRAKLTEGWRIFPQTGVIINRTSPFFLRWDVSPLGYLSTAAHGHLDALHLSLWVGGIAIIVDPGTGAYYGDRELRQWLASRRAHNGPCPIVQEWPQRLGPFLWSEHHTLPHLVMDATDATATLVLPGAALTRVVEVTGHTQVVVSDAISGTGPDFTVVWQFAPETKCEILDPRRFRITRQKNSIEIHVSADWDCVELVEHRQTAEREGIVSPHFRITTWAPYLKLRASGCKPCLFTTTFLAS